MSDGGQDLEPILQDYRGLVDGFMEKHADLKKRLDSLAASSSQGAGSSSGVPSYPGPDLAQFIYAYTENQSRILDFLRAHLDSRKAFDSLVAEKMGLQSELARFSEQVMILSKAALDASEEKGRLSNELESVRKEIGEAQQRNEGLLAQAAELEGIRRELADRKSELEATRSERDLLRERFESLSAERESGLAKLEGIEATERNLAEARRELEETRAKIGELEARLAEVRVEDDNLRKRVEQFESENRFSRERTETLQAEVDRLRAETVPRHELDRASRELSGVKGERDALLDQGKSQIERILSLEKEIERRRTQFEETINQKVDAEKALQESEARLVRSEARVGELQVQLEEALSSSRGPEPFGEDLRTAITASPVFERPLPSETTPPEAGLSVFNETEISMFQSDPDKVESLALSEDRDTLDAWSDAEEAPLAQVEPEPAPNSTANAPDSLVDFLDSSFGEIARAQAKETAPTGEWDKDDSIFDEIFKDAFPNEPRESVEDFRAAVESDRVGLVDRESSPDPFADAIETFVQARDPFQPSYQAEPPLAEGRERPSPVERVSAPDFPYPEITGAGMENYLGKKILLIGGDERFLSDYQHLFGLSSAELVYFPSLPHLEKNGVKRHVRECDMVVVFGAATEDPGVFRLKTIAADYGRLLVNHPSSGLVSLYHELQTANAEL